MDAPNIELKHIEVGLAKEPGHAILIFEHADASNYVIILGHETLVSFITALENVHGRLLQVAVQEDAV